MSQIEGNGRPVGPFRFCPYCATALVGRQIPPGEGPERRVCDACGFIEWGNAKPTASAIIEDGAGRILLGRRARDPFIGLWDVPGGFLEANEHPEQGVIREVREETGLTVFVDRFVGVYMDTYGPDSDLHTLNLYYACRISGGRMSAMDDVSELAWFDLRALPHPIAFKNANEALRDYLQQEGVRASEEHP